MPGTNLYSARGNSRTYVGGGSPDSTSLAAAIDGQRAANPANVASGTPGVYVTDGGVTVGQVYYVGDFYVDKLASTGSVLYVCTVQGSASTSTWVLV